MPRVSDMKERLTDAALDLMWENSYGTTSVDAICERADVRKGSFYYFFRSKSELAAAALEADWKKRKVDMDSIFSPTVPPRETRDQVATVRSCEFQACPIGSYLAGRTTRRIIRWS